MDHLILPDLLIALDDVNIDLPEKALRLREYRIGLLQEMTDQLPLAGHGGVDDDDKILNFPNLLGLVNKDTNGF